MHNVSDPKYTPSSVTMLPDEAVNNHMQKGSKGRRLRDSFCVQRYVHDIHTDHKRDEGIQTDRQHEG
jgi:hypothetical protein